MVHFINKANKLKNLLSGKNNIFLCDSNTAKECLDVLIPGTNCISIPAGEKSKQLENCRFIWDSLIEKNAGRNAHLICLGGGMICDIGAFAASCYMRGISYTLAPTSLLAMTDAAIGGKCGIDYQHLKNYIGLFAQAENILIYPPFLKSLPDMEWNNGYVEMLKHGLIADRSHFEEVFQTYQNGKTEITDALIQHSIEIKMDHVRDDFKESAMRKRLNFGHTVGHAIESLLLEQGKTIPHGQAVALGIIAESYISHLILGLSDNDLGTIIAAFHTLRGDISGLKISPDQLISYMYKDKKNRNNTLQFALLQSIGTARENISVEVIVVKESIEFLMKTV